MTRVLLLDDHALLRRGMRDALREEGLRVVGEAGCWNELKPLLRGVAADVLVLDINVPGPSGQDVLETLKTQRSPLRTLALSTDAQDAHAARALRTGAGGYLNKSCGIAALADAVRTVAQGRRYIAPAIASQLAEALAQPAQHPLHQRFSDREQQLLALLASGHRLPDIAERLELPPKTVSVYRARLLEKMKLSTNAELAHYAIHHKLVSTAGLRH
jgi:DNA-binding NarL/FixJ family response regulator